MTRVIPFQGFLSLTDTAFSFVAVPEKVFPRKGMSLAAMGFFGLKKAGAVEMEMLFPGYRAKMFWIAALSIFTDVMQFFFGRKERSPYDSMDEATNSISAETTVAFFADVSYPVPAVAVGVDDNTRLQVLREHGNLIQHGDPYYRTKVR